MATTPTTLTATPTGRSIIAGRHPDAGSSPILPHDAKFYAIDPHSGSQMPTLYLAATAQEVDDACWKAWQAFHWMSEQPAADRATLLEAIAQQILDVGEGLLALASDETGLGPARLVSERE